jgi:hypothetical protein
MPMASAREVEVFAPVRTHRLDVPTTKQCLPAKGHESSEAEHDDYYFGGMIPDPIVETDLIVRIEASDWL